MKPSPMIRHLVGGLTAYTLLAGAAVAQDAAPPAPPAPGKPANLCQELVAFVKLPDAANAAAATPVQQATAVSNPSGKTEGGKPSGGGPPQQTSGLSGSVNENGGGPASAPAAPNPAENPKSAANAAAKVPPPPAAPAPAPKPDAATVEKIEAAAGANDLAACRAAARSMRSAGVALPPPLLALSALDLKFSGQ